MKQIIKLLSFAFVVAPALAGGPAVYDDHHHHSHSHSHGHSHLGLSLGYRGYSGALVSAKSPAVLVSKGVPAIAAAVPAYTHGHAHAHAHAPLAYHGHALGHHHHAHAHSHSPLAYTHAHAHSLSHAPLAAYTHAHAPLAYSAHAHGHAHPHAHAHLGHAHAHAAPVAYVSSGGVGIPAAYAAYSVPTSEHVALLSAAGKPKAYGKSIPAAAIRNIETVMVTKTITPVVTKTTTHHTHAEPALSLGHVQGYSQNAIGHPKIAPVQFNTQYTTYANPTVGVNGPVLYSGGAVLAKTAGVAAVAAQPVLKTGIAAGPVAYAVMPAYAGLSLGQYSLVDDVHAHSVPAVNFLDLRSGKALGYGKKK